MGRRVKVGEDRRNPINSRIRDGLRERLEEAAKLSDRTLSHEIEERLERSFDAQDVMMKAFHNEKNLSIATAIVSAWRVIEIATGRPWTDDAETVRLARKATEDVLRLVRPINADKESDQIEGGLGALGQIYSREKDADLIAGMAAYSSVCMARGEEPAKEYVHMMWEAADRYFGRGEGARGDTPSSDDVS